MANPVTRIDRFQRRHTPAGFPLAVLYKFFDDQGSFLAALIAYYAFLSIFPILLLLVTVLGFVLQNDAGLQTRLLNSAFSQIPVLGDQLTGLRALKGSIAAVIVGVVGGIYGSLGVSNAAQNAMNKVWAIPRNSRPNPLKARLRSLIVLPVLALGLVATAVVTALPSIFDFSGPPGVLLRVLAFLLAFGVDVSLFVIGYQLLTAKDLTVRQIRPGAVIAALGWLVLQRAGTFFVGHIGGSGGAYGVFSVVLGLIVYLFLFAIVLVFCAEINVVLSRRLWPRALLTPFTDNVSLTEADKRAYASYPRAERHKGFERVEVHFGPQDPRTPAADSPDPASQRTTVLPPSDPAEQRTTTLPPNRD